MNKESIILIVILIGIILLLYFYYKRAKKFRFDSLVMVNGGVGSGKSSLTIHLAIRSHKKAHAIWWRRKYIYSKIFKKMKNEEEPILYSNIPVYKNIRKNELYKFYQPLTLDHILRTKRFNFKSIIIIDESSLLANSMTGSVRGKGSLENTKYINDQLTLFLKLIRHELHGCYKNIFGGYANIFINTQSKNDNHFAFDRCINQVLYITKSYNLPFFKLVFTRDLLLIDSVENNFDEDYKESLSTRWYLMPKNVFKRYDSYAYSFLTDKKDIITDITEYIILSGMFEIVTLTTIGELIESNKYFHQVVDEMIKNNEIKEIEENGE